MRRWKKRLAYSFGLLAIGAAGTTWYVKSHPLVFNESFWQHAHCMKIASLGFHDYAEAHRGEYPKSSLGYGDALLLMPEDFYAALTGPSYHAGPMFAAKSSGRPLAESDCGRVYVQGLNRTSSPDIALLYDKVATPGGDHCHMFDRMFAPLGREVLYVDGTNQFILESEWPDFVSKQRSLLMQAGFDLKTVEHFYPAQ